jgi:hypothetical protein
MKNSLESYDRVPGTLEYVDKITIRTNWYCAYFLFYRYQVPGTRYCIVQGTSYQLHVQVQGTGRFANKNESRSEKYDTFHVLGEGYEVRSDHAAVSSADKMNNAMPKQDWFYRWTSTGGGQGKVVVRYLIQESLKWIVLRAKSSD